MEANELALFLTKAAAVYNNRRSLRLTPVLQNETARELAAPNILSVKAISAIVGCSEEQTLAAIGRDKNRPRGKLNPSHIAFIGYLLSLREMPTITLNYMLDHGTSLSTIATLGQVSQATLYRWRNDGDRAASNLAEQHGYGAQ